MPMPDLTEHGDQFRSAGKTSGPTAAPRISNHTTSGTCASERNRKVTAHWLMIKGTIDPSVLSLWRGTGHWLVASVAARIVVGRFVVAPDGAKDRWCAVRNTQARRVELRA